jgi:hypothetical protein
MENKIIQDMISFCSRFKMPSMESESCPLGLKEVVDFQSEGLGGRTTEEIELFIFRTHSYNTVLKNKKNSIRAFVTGLSSIVDKFVAENLESVDKYLPYPAKRDLVVSGDEKVSAINAKLVSAKMQLDKIGDLPAGIDATLRSLESYLRRRHTGG